MYWPSKPFRETYDAKAAGTRGLQNPAEAMAAVEHQLDDLKQGASQAQRAKLEKAAALLPKLGGNAKKQDEFVALVLSIVDGSQLDPTEGLPQIRKKKGSELLARLSDAPAEGTRGIGNLFGGIAGGVGTFLNLTKWYVMKDRSGTVGAKGVATAVRALHDRCPAVKIHLVGHSLGGRLMASCAKALCDAPTLQPDSLMLLEAAFSHFGFSADNGHGKPGFFRNVIDKQRGQRAVPVDVLGAGHCGRRAVRDHVAAGGRQHQGDRRRVRRVRRHRPERTAQDDGGGHGPAASAGRCLRVPGERHQQSRWVWRTDQGPRRRDQRGHHLRIRVGGRTHMNKHWLGGAVAALLAAFVWACTTTSQPTDIVTEFKYGAVGTEETVGVPYWLWVVLPEVFADKLPNRPGNGYERLGFIYETPTSDLPIGASRSGGMQPRVGLNCATCHAGAYRDAPGASPAIVLGMPAHQMDLQAYARFLSAIAKDPRFNADTLIPAMQKHPGSASSTASSTGLSRSPARRRASSNGTDGSRGSTQRPPQGPGRVDTFNPYKAMFAEAKNFEIDDTVGTADLPSLWNQRMRQGMWLHWDGNNNSVDERNKSAAIGAGATPDSLDLDGARPGRELDSRPEAAVVPGRADQHHAGGRGRAHLSGELCELPRRRSAAGRTDDRHCRGRHRSRTAAIVHAGAGRRRCTPSGRAGRGSSRISGRRTAMPACRSTAYGCARPISTMGPCRRCGRCCSSTSGLRGSIAAYNVYDWGAVGFVSSGTEAEQQGVVFDTSLRGNGNGGHTYGRELSVQDREALLEYLKTL